MREIRETLDRLILVGEEHLRHVLKKIEYHQNRQRPHQALDNVIPLDFECPEEPAAPETLRCDANSGGLLNYYYAERATA